MIGRTLSSYRVVEKLGAGAMGEVYLARDERLGRDVALKILPERQLGGEAARARFRNEAQALLRLSHPHVATLFDFGSADGADFLVMERVGGSTLDILLLRAGPLPEKELLRLGSQLARGLTAAHEAGIVHRDLKPANLALTPDGLLKILDFGLARLHDECGADGSTAQITAPGAFLGTPAYMSPEQTRGEPADARTDVYGAGAVLYELATGRQVFAGRKGSELTRAILSEGPEPPRQRTPSLSPGFEALVLKAIDKDPALRYQSSRELLVDLERLQQESPASSSEEDRWRRPRVWQRVSWVLASGAVVGLLAWLLVPPAPPRITAIRPLAQDLVRGPTITSNLSWVSWASDRKFVYFGAPKGLERALFQVPTAGGDPVEISVSFRHGLSILGYVPGESALLVRGQQEPPTTGESDRGWPLWLVPVPFGTPRRIPKLVAFDAAVAPDDHTIALLRFDDEQATSHPRLLVAGIDGSIVRDLGLLPTGANGLCWAPDGGVLRFSAGAPGPAASGRSLGVTWPSWDRWIWEIPATGGQSRPIGPGGAGGWTADGRYFVFERQESAFHRGVFAWSSSRWPPWRTGRPERLTVGPVSFWNAGPGPDGRGLFAYGQTGRGELMRFDPITRAYAPMLGGESAIEVDASRDGEWLAWVRFPEGTLWKSRKDGSGRQALTSAPLEAHLPRWSPDGRRIVFAARSPAEPQFSIHVAAADGSRDDVVARPAKSQDHYWGPCWLPDGTIVFGQVYVDHPPGLLTVDPRTLETKGMVGAERLRWPKCSRQGDLLAVDADAKVWHFKVRHGADSAWEDLGPETLVYPNWTRDGRSFCGVVDTAQRVACFSLATRILSSVGPVTPFRLLSTGGGEWMGLDGEDRPMVAADRSTIGFYALDWEAP